MTNHDFLSHQSILITGASGFVGSLLVNKLLELNEKEHLSLNLYALVRDIKKAEQMYPEAAPISFISADITNPLEALTEDGSLPDKLDSIIHCAAPTKSAYMVSNPVETADAIVAGTKNILKLAKRLRVKSMVYLSSMEVYGKIEGNGEALVTEDMAGYIDPLSARSSYPLGKRMAENYCYSYYHEYQVPVKIARLAQTFGKGILVTENRIFAQIAWSVIEGRDIILHTTGQSMGNYVDSEEAAEAILLLLSKGDNGEAYNIVHEANTMSISDMARLAAKEVGEGKIKVVYQTEGQALRGYAPETGLRLSSEKIRSLGWEPRTGLSEMYRNMIQWMKSSQFTNFSKNN